MSSGELQRLRLATQLSSQLFGVVYVLDEPSAGLHPADGDALLAILHRLKAAGNSLFVVEHDLEVIRHADWLVDVGPEAGERGGRVLYSGPPAGLADVAPSFTRRYLFGGAEAIARTPRQPQGWLRLEGVTRNNLHDLDIAFPVGCFTAVTGVSGSGKSSLVSQALPELVAARLGRPLGTQDEDEADPLLAVASAAAEGRIVGGMERIRRVVRVDQKPIGRTPRSNLATYSGLFDHVRQLFADTPAARKRRYGVGRFSFNVAQGRCPTCEGEGFVMVELLFLPSVYAPCSTCNGSRYNAQTLEIEWQGRNIAQVLAMSVDEACECFAGEPQVLRPLEVLREIGLGYLRLAAGNGTVGRRGAAYQAGDRTAARAARQYAVYPRRTDRRPASGRYRPVDAASAGARGCRQYGRRRRARHAGRRAGRLGDRSRAGGGGRRRTGHCERHARRGRRRGAWQHRGLPQDGHRAVRQRRRLMIPRSTIRRPAFVLRDRCDPCAVGVCAWLGMPDFAHAPRRRRRSADMRCDLNRRSYRRRLRRAARAGVA